MSALDPAQRRRHTELVQRFKAGIKSRIELADGYTYALNGDVLSVIEVAEWSSLERLCCPFLTILIQVAGADGAPQVTLRGPEGSKAVLREEFPGHE